MKQCPACKTTYTDDTLRFCLADGNPLADPANSQETVMQGGGFHDAETIAIGGGPARVEIPRDTVQMAAPAQASAPASSKSSGVLFKAVMVLIGLGIFGVIAIAAGAFIYFNMNGPEKPANRDTGELKTATSPVPSPTKDDEDELREQIANIEKLINDQKNDKQPANIPVPEIPSAKKKATVNSPGDGFLALRTMPSSDIGDRIMKIPHGAAVTVGFCEPVLKQSDHSGRWCQANYEGHTGWVFDAYLIY